MLIQDEVLDENIIGVAVSKVPESYRQQVRAIFESYKLVKPSETAVKMHIKLKDPRPVASHPRQLSPAKKVEVKKQIDGWIRDGVVEPGTSEYVAPLESMT